MLVFCSFCVFFLSLPIHSLSSESHFPHIKDNRTSKQQCFHRVKTWVWS